MEVFEIVLNSGEKVKGAKWLVKDGKANFVFITGMQEYATRYERLANYLNEKVLTFGS